MGKNLTEAGVRAYRPGDQRYEVPDGLLPGLRLIVQPSGVKSWAVRTRINGRTAKVTLDRYPTLDLKEARKRARKVLEAAGEGADPRAKKGDTVEAAVADWLKRDQGGNRGHDEVKRIFDRDVLPRWGSRPLSKIARRDAVQAVDALVDRGSVTAARRLHAHLHRFFRWSVGRGLIDANPMADLPKPGRENPRDRWLADDELAEVWRAAEAMAYPFGSFVRLLILTAARAGTNVGSGTGLLKLRWSEVDLEANVIRFPAERMKMDEAHVVPLSPQARALLEGLPRRKVGDEDSPWVFTTNGKAHFSGVSKAKAQLDAKMKPMPAWRLHDLRRTVATHLQRMGHRLEVVEEVLGHVSGTRAGIVGVYQRHRFEDEKRAALEDWGRHVEAILSEKNNNVVVLKP